MHKITTFALCSLALICSACSSGGWMGKEEEEKIEGTRISVLSFSSDVEVDSSLAGVPVALPATRSNQSIQFEHQWNTQHLALPEILNKAGDFSAGDSSKTGMRLTASPVVGDNIMYVLDGRGVVRAFLLNNLSKAVWEQELPTGEVPDELLRITFGTTRKTFQGGSLALAQGILFASTGNGMVVALNAKDGSSLWERTMGAPIRSAPIARDGRLFVITITNQLYALDVATGRTLWSYEGYKQTTSILGYPTPALFENILVAPFSSGELAALRTENGRPVWGESLSLLSPKNSSVVMLNDIDASPIISDNILYAVSHEGVLIAIDILTGKRVWEQPISSINTPWIAGNFLFVMTTKDELICLYRPDSRVKWVVPFVSHEDEENKKDKIVWSGPVVAGGKIYAVGSHGVMVAIDPESGAVLETKEVNDAIYQPPLVIDEKLYLIDNKAEISVYH